MKIVSRISVSNTICTYLRKTHLVRLLIKAHFIAGVEAFHNWDWWQALDWGEKEGGERLAHWHFFSHNNSGDVTSFHKHRQTCWLLVLTGAIRSLFSYVFQAPSILSETESSIERSLGQFSGDMANLDTAVKALSTVAVDQAGKYKNSIKKDYQVVSGPRPFL